MKIEIARANVAAGALFGQMSRERFEHAGGLCKSIEADDRAQPTDAAAPASSRNTISNAGIG
ncbi:MAG TPA: hypothetical protein VIR56_08335 [Solimonas sp.]